MAFACKIYLMKKDIIITAGGFGRRLWPVSTYEKPKQFMSLEGDISFLQSTILRSHKLQLDGYIIIVTRKDLFSICKTQIEELTDLLPDEEMQNLLDRLIIILEPFSNGTVNSVLLALQTLQNIHKEDSLALLMPSDHIIGPYEYFFQDVKKGFMLSCHNKIVCYGIEPMYPATNYGYIEMGEILELDNVMYEDAHFVLSFQEKPEIDRAKNYLEQGHFLWNTAIYTFPVSLMIQEYKTYQKNIYEAFQSLSKNDYEFDTSQGFKILHSNTQIENVYKNSHLLSFDFGITTHTKKACVINASFSWEDVGNWDSFSSLFTPPTEKIVEIQGNNNFIYSDIPVALCGVENLCVIIKNGEALILKKGSGELVKEAYAKMKELLGEQADEFLE